MTALIYLVGFMGAGKSTVGRRLAERLGWSFVDLDIAIEARAGEPIRELFRRAGELHFRRLESEELRRVSGGARIVVALGGGAFCLPENEATVRATGTSVYLDAPAGVLYARCDGDDARPLFSDRAGMEELLDRRRPLYERADFRVDASCPVEEVVDQILGALERDSA
jgi:shikimate kinase